MLYTAAGPGDSSPSPFHTYHILGSSRHTVLHTSIIPATCRFFNYFRLFSRFFVRFCTVFRIFWPPGPTCRAEPAAGKQKQGAGRPRGAATPHPGGPWPPPHRAGPPGPERRRRERRGEPRRPGAARPRRRATAGRPARQERAEGERVHRGGYRRAGPEGPTTPNPRRPGPAARGAARRR